MNKSIYNAFYVLAVLCLITSACSKPAAPGKPLEEAAQLNPQNNGQLTVQSEKQGIVKPLSYTDKHIEKVREAMKALEMKTVYVPRNGSPDDRLDWVEVDHNVLILHYKKMDITEYQKARKPTGRIKSEEEVKLLNGTGKWHTIGKRKTLSLQMPEAFIVISSPKGIPTEELERVAESLEPVTR